MSAVSDATWVIAVCWRGSVRRPAGVSTSVCIMPRCHGVRQAASGYPGCRQSGSGEAMFRSLPGRAWTTTRNRTGGGRGERRPGAHRLSFLRHNAVDFRVSGNAGMPIGATRKFPVAPIITHHVRAKRVRGSSNPDPKDRVIGTGFAPLFVLVLLYVRTHRRAGEDASGATPVMRAPTLSVSRPSGKGDSEGTRVGQAGRR